MTDELVKMIEHFMKPRNWIIGVMDIEDFAIELQKWAEKKEKNKKEMIRIAIKALTELKLNPVRPNVDYVAGEALDEMKDAF